MAAIVQDVEPDAAYCAKATPKVMRSKALVVVGEIPRTATNKIEKFKLHKAFLEQSHP
ncbi:hypothetical protein [Gordonia sp. NPDC003376]